MGTVSILAHDLKKELVYLKVFIITNGNISAYFLTITRTLTGHSILLISS